MDIFWNWPFEKVATRSWRRIVEGITRTKRTQYLQKVCIMFEGKDKVSLAKM